MNARLWSRLFWQAAAPMLAALLAAALAAAELPVDFDRQIRPILSEHCLQCHGPDAQTREADLRLDERAGLLARDPPVIVPGRSRESELWKRIAAADPDARMPPSATKRLLTDAQKQLVARWIDEGAPWSDPWALVPPARPPLPAVTQSDWPRGPIDAFLLARLEQENLRPAGPAPPATLLRRVTLSLTGLPPAPDEAQAFLADSRPDAYERVVDRLLASPRYGERMAVPWLEAARYADTSGYQSDGERFMWRWRDWVIDALNANLPFDQFTIEQLAGDLLPQPTLDQRIATGFHRNHRGNAEGGIVPEEYAVEYVADRVETTATVWLGLTLGCCRCHDHKYDPFTQRDFYALFAFFNNVPEKGRAIKFGNSPPYLAAPTRQQAEELAGLEARLAEAEAQLAAALLRLDDELAAWERRMAASGQAPADWSPDEHLARRFALDEALAAAANADGRAPVSPCGAAKSFTGDEVLEDAAAGDFGFYDKFSLAAWVRVAEDGGGTIVSRMADVPQGDGYQLAVVQGKLQFNLVKRWLDDALRVETAARLAPGAWHHVAATYDGSRTADGVRLFVDGRPQPLVVLLDELNQSFATKEPLRVGGGGGPQGRFRGALDEVRVYSDALAPSDIAVLATPATIAQIASRPPAERTAAERQKLEMWFLERGGPDGLRAAYRQRQDAARAVARFRERLPTVMVMEEMPVPRPTHILVRGQYDKPGEPVTANVPARLPPLPSTAPRNRLGLAQWLVDPHNPLTARVAVNRLWQLYFGTGLVKTTEDFGRQGEPPSHSELLDWLAVEFQGAGFSKEGSGFRVQGSEFGVQGSEFGVQGSGTLATGSRPLAPGPWPLAPGHSPEGSGFRVQGSDQAAGRAWDMKRLVRQMVTSAAFRQSSAVSPALRAKDPENRLLARGPRLRLTAEMVRDQALFASGLLVEQLGGPSVRPWQPAGLWSELTGGDDYQPGAGAERVRRSLYTFWKRTIPPPALATFDAPARETCTVHQSRTNTPLQALALLNEPTMLAAARGLAERVSREGATADERIGRAVVHVLGRRPAEDELAVLRTALARYQRHYEAHPDEAARLLAEAEVALREVAARAAEPAPARSNDAALAALTLTCSTILNLDEAVTRQ